MNKTHKHCYVFEFPLQRRDGLGCIIQEYSLLSNIDGPKHKQNREWLEQGLRAAYGFYPKGVKYKYDKYR